MVLPSGIGKERFIKRAERVVNIITDEHIIETFKIERIEPRFLKRAIKECFIEEIDIILGWAKHFRNKGIPYVITKQIKNSGNVFSIWNEWKDYKADTLKKEGWRIKE